MGHMHGVYANLHGQRIMSYVDLVGRYVTVSSKEHLVQSHHGYFPRLNWRRFFPCLFSGAIFTPMTYMSWVSAYPQC